VQKQRRKKNRKQVRQKQVFRYNYKVLYKKLFLLAVILVVCTGCNATLATPTVSAPQFVTATLPPTSIPASTPTPPLPTVAPTITPIAGKTTTEVNIRADTSTGSASLGTVAAFSAVQIIGKDASGIWLLVLFNEETGWVRADYVQVENLSAEIPVVGVDSGAGGGARGVVLSGVNIRSGAGREFESLGLLIQNDVVSVLGKDPSGAWFKIAYAPAPDGTGWVAAEFLQVANTEALPVLEAAQSEVRSTEAPAMAVSIQTALMDEDSEDAPLGFFQLSTISLRSAQVQGEVSMPGGDVQDWIGFSAQSAEVVIQVICESGSLLVELSNNGEVFEPLDVDCGGKLRTQVSPGNDYLIRLSPAVLDVYIRYELRIGLDG
jgi:uncharacterized protein YraI